MYGVVDVLLNFQQFKNEVPDSPLYYLLFGMLILYQRINVPTSSFEGLADPPLTIEKWNPSTRMLERVCAEVWLHMYIVCNTCIHTCTDLHVQVFLFTGAYCTTHSTPSKGEGCWKASCDGTHHSLQR